MNAALPELLRRSIKEPVPAVFEAWNLLSKAVDAHLNGDRTVADGLFRQANLPEVWSWVNPAWGRPDLNVRISKPEGDTQVVPKAERDPFRNPPQSVRAAVLKRDGYRCRYCGIPVIARDVRHEAHKLYPEAIPWHAHDPRQQHAAFQCFWLQYDHVVPHSHGGSSSEDNVVVCCALCNYGKDKYTLRQLGVEDPRRREPEATNWDGLERLRARVTLAGAAVSPLSIHTYRDAFFLPGAWINAAYLFTPPIAGKERWFKIGAEVSAEPAIRNGVRGCRLVCDPSLLSRRGLNPEAFLDTEPP